jgi:ABC-type transport system involved in multi-copper enzyme maturation permease subunit
MAMWWIIARREVVDNIRSLRVPAAAVLAALLMVFSFAMLAGDYVERRQGHEQRDRQGQTRGGKRPKLTAAPQTLSTLARGWDRDNGRLLIITWSQPRRQPGASPFDQGTNNPLHDLFDAPDLVHLFRFVFSLMALFFSYDAVCGERQRGTLALVFASPVGRSEFLAGKWLGGSFSLLLALAPGLGLVALGLAGGDGWVMGWEDWLRASGIVGLSLLYAGIFLAVGLAFSAWCGRAVTALTASLVLWTVWGIGIPQLARPVARFWLPVAPVQQIEAEKSALRQGDYASYLDYANACWAMDDRYMAGVDAQSRLTQALSRLSPTASYVYSATALAATGIEDARRFRDGVVRWDRQQRRVGYNWQEEIPFVHRRPSGGQSLAIAGPDATALFLWNGLWLVTAALAFSRRDLGGGEAL